MKMLDDIRTMYPARREGGHMVCAPVAAILPPACVVVMTQIRREDHNALSSLDVDQLLGSGHGPRGGKCCPRNSECPRAGFRDPDAGVGRLRSGFPSQPLGLLRAEPLRLRLWLRLRRWRRMARLLRPPLWLGL